MTFQQVELFEEWRQVIGYEGLYEVSSFGRVRSVAHKWTKGRLLNLQVHKYDGYLQLGLTRNKKISTLRVHRLVAEAFLGPCPINKQVDHIDGVRTHNSVLNLRYVTPLENRRAAVARRGEWVNQLPPHPTYGEKNGSAKLTANQVIEVRRLRLEGMKITMIAKEFGVSARLIYKILSGELRKKG